MAAATSNGFGLVSSRRGRRRIALVASLALVAALISVIVPSSRAIASGSPCGPTVNPIVCENEQPGTPESVWDVDGAGDPSIQGFATDISVDEGQTIKFKVDTNARAYTIDIYRLGYYGGDGARLEAKVSPSATLPQTQPNCLVDPSVTLVDCGDWGVSASWAVPSTAVSGVYLARLTRTDTGGASLIPFIVRDDASTADIVYQTSDPTWEAYNRYGDADFYTGSTTNLWDSQSRARKISYNRPFATREDSSGRDFLFSNEYPAIRFLERNGYDVTYIAGVDTDRYGATLLQHHKVFMSIGHDEYWSQAQRTNVENARDAGVNLMFLSGNEVFWHTRYEPSIDASNTPYRTLVCYKETWDNAPTDPTGEATATWRDPRFSAAPGGSNPENGLTGTIYMANSIDLPITVTKAEGKLREWRNTNLASMSGSSTALAPDTVGYESDEDLDNGFRPKGLIDLSTTTGASPQESIDFGQNTAPGTTTHHITLYRASSGALVFGAGTVQWAWGLDSHHDGTQNPADSRMQQFMINMFADMHVQPQTLMTGLVAASASTDTQPPTSTITSPNNGASIANGTKLTVSGTATDNGGGAVAGVEVSIDGGATWHPATGTTAWSYTGVIHGDGPVKIESRASDDSANVETPSAGVTVNTGCPCTVFGDTTPSTPDSGDASAVEAGMRFTPDADGYVTGVRFYKSSLNTGTHTGTLWSASGTALATGTFTNESGSGWQTLQFTTPVAVSAGMTYVVSYYAPNGHYSADIRYFYYHDIDATPLVAQSNSPTDDTKFNGVYATSHAFPTKTYDGSNYYVDPIFTSAASGTPAVVNTNPVAGGTGVPTSVTPSATFSTSVTASSMSFKLSGPTGSVAGSVAYDDTSKTATFTPSTALAANTVYTATVSATSTDGKAMASPATWTFTTAPNGSSCPCTLFAANAVPTTPDSGDRASLSVGVRFSSAVSGYVTGVRFYKSAANTGTHTGSLWSLDGTRLATGTFSNETASGWQTLTFATPVAVTAGTSYVVSYYAPNGHYAEDDHYFDTSLTNGPLTAPVGAGVYVYGGDVYPSSSYANANYWVDPIFSLTKTPAPTPPTVTSTSPPSGATGVPVSAVVSATFSASVTASSVQLTLAGPSGAVAGSVAYVDSTKTATFTPSAALAASTKYNATVSATGTTGAPMAAPVSWSFTTGAGSSSCPCTLFAANATPTTADSGDRAALSLGLKFSSSVPGYIAGVRFYKSAANTGTHTASLWSTSGTRLATATFTGESASGWQTVTFSPAVQVSAGVTYVVSYYAPSGHYAEDDHYFDSAVTNGPLSAPVGAGVYVYGGDAFPTSSYANANYWVDPIFTASGSLPAPTVTSTSPASGATGVPTTVKPSATFSASVSASSVSFTVSGPSGAVAGSVAYDATSQTATFTPSAALVAGTKYTASVSATGTNGVAMAAPATWSFTTAAATASCPCTLFAANATPTTADSGDRSSLSVGVRFSSSMAGYVTGLRFYKSAANTGTHTGSLWSASGTRLATGTFSNETASGWQTLAFATPVAITAGTTYVVSYYDPAGHYAEDDHYFDSQVTSGPLVAPVSAGVYIYGGDAFPSSSYANANYWVDPVFTTSPPGG